MLNTTDNFTKKNFQEFIEEAKTASGEFVISLENRTLIEKIGFPLADIIFEVRNNLKITSLKLNSCLKQRAGYDFFKEFKDIKHLKKITLKSNYIYDISLLKMEYIEELDLTNNLIENVSPLVINMPNLRTLRVSNNLIKDINSLERMELNVLNISKNLVEEMPLFENSSLTKVSSMYNCIPESQIANFKKANENCMVINWNRENIVSKWKKIENSKTDKNYKSTKQIFEILEKTTNLEQAKRNYLANMEKTQ